MSENNRKINYENLPVVVMVGRVNVGKSTLFNRLTEQNKALVSDIPGTTRTSNEGLVLWRGKYVKLIDTGGLSFAYDVPLEEDIIKQSERAMKEADLVLFVTDAKVGILPQEKELAKRLRRLVKKPVILLANKIDTKKMESNVTEPDYAKLGLGVPFPISAVNGRNVGDLLDIIFKKLHSGKVRPKTKKIEKNEIIDISLIGKPNVGKSSLFNKLIGQDKVIVSEMPHTTREPFNTELIYEYSLNDKKIKQKINFIDTAGIRRKAKVKGKLEKSGIQKSIKSIEESDIVLFVLDAAESISHQDKQLGGLIEKRGKSVLILLNKWDLSEDNSQAKRKEITKFVRAHFPHLKFAPIEFVSGLTGYGVHKIFPTIIRIYSARHTHIPDPVLQKFLDSITKEKLPSRGKGTRHPKIVGIKQTGIAPPVIELTIKYRTSLHSSYVNYIENKLRERFDFTGTPIIIKLTKMKR
ncbi:MAG: ribosome biogenesis GTPase Der [Candidatus Magasanikbacteria bacterium]|nr:ribosome biogenesis GTPase Der [Candidatus Magasanikbacteria bacterium]